MTLQSAARTAFANIAASIPEATVSVVCAGRTAQGIVGASAFPVGGTAYGEQGADNGVVYVSAAAIDKPVRGSTITIAGRSAFVMDVETDPAGAIWTINYSKQRPVEGI